MRISQFTLLAFQLNGGLDTEKYNDITTDDVEKHIEDGTIFGFLKSTLEGFDDSLLDPDDRDELIEEWKQNVNTIDEGRKMCVDKNGLCLLVAYLLEGIQRRASDMSS